MKKLIFLGAIYLWWKSKQSAVAATPVQPAVTQNSVAATIANAVAADAAEAAKAMSAQ